jgi:uncharacterized damage-inducible protein DinB
MNKTERQRKLESYESAYQKLIAAIREFPAEMWQFRPEADSWTIHETIIHITDSETHSFARCRKAIAEPGSAVMAYNEPVWAKALNYHEQSTDDALELFKWLRGNTYNLIKNLPDAMWSQTIEHPENGTMTLDDWLADYDDHVSAHIAQMRAVYEQWAKQKA